MSQSKTATNHEEIGRCLEHRYGIPRVMKSLHRKTDRRMHGIDFPGGARGGSLIKTILGDESFAKFDGSHLVFPYPNKPESSDEQARRVPQLVSRAN